MNHSMPGLAFLHYLPEFVQTHDPWDGDAIHQSHPLLLPSSALSLSQHQGLFQWVSSLHQVAKILEFQLQNQSSNENSGLIVFRINRFDLLTVQVTLMSLQHHNSKASILWPSAFFTVQLSHLYITIGKTIALTIRTSVGKMTSLFSFSMLPRLVISCLPRSKRLLNPWLHPPSTVIF